ncbi:diaminopimelate epimerase [Thiohalobacter sp.]|uniref:diaminopimelate epimerase n=1 Tax=Thiohalobacter sp. TaxID=2025948 RepID=UPI00260B3DE7|nr:diaminopimelate epimerase [Thiohalobacter sp.]
MRLEFTKMHGLGNDFVVIDGIHQTVPTDAATLARLADRRRGIGCDQILIVEPPRAPGAEFRYRIFNADGGEVEQCGNGARCFARFVREKGLTDRDRFPVETLAGVIELRVRDDEQVEVDMGVPRLEPAEIPFEAPARAPRYALEVAGETLEVGAVSMGNPHAVLEVDDVDSAPVARLGPAIEHHPRFPRRTNVGFMQVVAPDHIRLRVHERGAGETEACGTGACAAMVIGRLWGRLDPEVTVSLPGGDLVISWAGEGTPVIMTGPAETVFEGSIEL